MQEPARPHFSFLSPVNSRFCCSQLQVFRSEASCLLRLANQVPFLLGFEYFPFSFFYLFLASFTPFSQTHWLLSSGWWHCWLSRGRGCTTPREQWIFPIICLSPTSPLLPRSPPPSLQHPPITQPFSEVIWGSLEREELPLRVHLGRQKGLELYSLGSIANKAKPCEWRQSQFSVLWLILLVCRKEEKRWDGERVGGEMSVCWVLF